MRFQRILQLLAVGVLLLPVAWGSATRVGNWIPEPEPVGVDSMDVIDPAVVPVQVDSPEIDLPFPINDPQNPYESDGRINLTDPSNVDNYIEYDPETGLYYFYSKMGDQINYRNPTVMTFEEFQEYNEQNTIRENWSEVEASDQLASDDEDGPDPFRPSLEVDNKLFDRIFGGNTIDIRPQGSAELTFGVNVNKNENPQIPVRQRSITTFNFDQRIQLNVVGNIGDKLKLSTNYNTEATFNFENQTKIEYTGYEDEIIQKIEAGNVSLPIQNSLITGSQSLFGFKTKMKFGNLTATGVFSQERSQRKEIVVQGGAQTQEFEMGVDNYEANRHYFLSGYFRDRYNQALQSLPVVNSGVNITRIEVWVVNRRANVEDTRNIIALTDIGEDEEYQNPELPLNIGDDPSNQIAYNGQNNLYNTLDNTGGVRGFQNSSQALNGLGLVSGRDYERLSNARQLDPSEYTFNSRLGFISLNQALNNDQVLAVSYQYTLDGQTYQVGDLSNDGYTAPDALFVKLLKSTVVDVQNPLWDLMMKNVYNLGSFQVNSEDFIFEIKYNDPREGIDIPIIPQPGIDDEPLIQVFGMDRLDQNGNPTPDGRFDFVDNAATEGGTIQSENGRVYFTTVEPFGRNLRNKLEEEDIDESAIEQIVYQPLYDSTKIVAQQDFLPLNRFKLTGTYKSASSDEIYLNALNIPQGAVQVSAGGRPLVENKDYTVDYNLGRVKIINTGLLESQTPIKISVESNTLFSVQTKTLLGGRFDYRITDDFNVGATILHLYERPLTQKVNIGDEPMANTLWGLDASYSTDSRLITDVVDALPGIETKEESRIDVTGEFAHLIPGHSRAIGQDGNSYLDDFEGAISTIDLRNFQSWSLASIPQGQPSIWPEASSLNDRSLGYNRANFAWYIIDPLFFRNDNITPDNINPDRHYQREVLETEVFPNRELPTGTPTNIATFDLAFYPTERGQYNYDAEPTSLSAGVDPQTGELNDPESRWGGAMRSLVTTDFEQTNVQTIQFWMMDPYNPDSRQFLGTEGNNNGALYVHLGNVSEDVLRDGQMSFENGIPLDADNPDGLTTTLTEWGRIPTTQSIVNAFDNTTNSNAAQDIGLDGWDDEGEQTYFEDFLDDIQNLPGVDQQVINDVTADPSGDNYAHFRDPGYNDTGADIVERYKRFNGMDGNSITTEDADVGYPIQGTTLPSTEDVNQDLTLAEAESYFQYKINLPDPNVNPTAWQVGNNYINDVLETNVDGRTVRWYQFKIPVREGQSINNIQDFRSIRFMRMITKGFETPVVLRFARMELIRGEWRRFTESLTGGGPRPTPEGSTSFEISAVNIEENGRRSPINYVVPPGINREQDVGSANLRSLNEQSLSLKVVDLEDGDARAAFRSFNIDARLYGKMKMFIHGERVEGEGPLNFGDVSVFVRLGTDFQQNYYEYEVPLEPTGFNESQTPQNIWKSVNEMEIDFNFLQSAKNQRNRSNFDSNSEYVVFDGDRRVTIKGNPVLSSIRTVMVGVRNPDDNDNPWTEDVGNRHAAEVWVNELRLTDFEQQGGYAAVARMTAQLADFGTVAINGNISTPGFGGLETKVADRQQETIIGFDASSNLQMGKFLPEDWGVKIPLFMSYSQLISRPRFDPLSPDLELDEVTDGLPREERQRIRQRSQSFQRRRSINLTNMRVERQNQDSKPLPWSISNFNLTLAYSDVHRYDINTAFDNSRQFRVGLGYNYTLQPKKYEPFAETPLFQKSNWLKLIGDFNFYLLPKQVSFQTNVDRTYQESQARNNTDVFSFEQPVLVTKTFNWSRIYNVQYDLTDNLGISYNANNMAIIGEPPGRVTKDEPDLYEAYQDSVWQSLTNFGETTQFSQNISGNYRLPIDKLPLLDWTSTDVTYTGSYRWDRAPFSQDTLGNTIQNSRNMSVNTQFNFLNLYNKLGYFERVNQKFRRLGRGSGRGSARGRGRGGRSSRSQDQDEKEEEEEKDDRNKISALDYAAKILMSIKNFSFRYSRNEGTILPGYRPQTQYVGLDPGFNHAPGLPFVLGHQIDGFNWEAANRGWVVDNPYQNRQYMQTYTEDINMRLNLEPLPNLRIELNALRQKSTNEGSFFRFNNDVQDYLEQSRFESGSFSISYIAWGSAFEEELDNNVSPTFQTFAELRDEISTRLALETGFSEPGSGVVPGYADGYGPTSQEVILPAFLAAYGDRNPSSVPLKLEDFTVMDMMKNPNWNVSYDGLTKFEFFKNNFRTISLNHSYRSVFSVNNFTTNLEYEITPDGVPTRDNSEEANFLPERQIQSFTISEQFSPLFSIDATWLNSLITKFEINRTRTLSFSTSNYQLIENVNREFVIGVGYRIPGVEIRIGGKKRKSDLNLRADLSIRDTEIITRRLVEGTNQITSGQNIISIKTAADYVISEQLNIRVFYDQQINTPKVSTTFPTSNINAGISLRFTLTQ